MKLQFTDRFTKDYDSLRDEIRAKVDSALGMLLVDPRHSSLRVKKMHRFPGVWEARVDRQHRMTFEIREDCYVMRKVGKHDETLRQP